MPLLLIFGTGAVAGFFVGKGTDGLSSLAKWVAIGGAVYVVAKVTKVV